MQTIYRPDPEQGYASVLLHDLSDRARMTSINFGSIAKSWVPIHFNFYFDAVSGNAEPDVAVVVPSIAMRKQFATQVFSDELSNVELLPIVVSGQEWVLLNCLVSTKGMDLKKSIYYQDPSGVIFLMREIFVSDPDLQEKLLFTIDGSNRSTAFVLERFVSLFQSLKLRGIKFKPVGMLG